MELFLDCLPCLHRQTLEAARIASSDEARQAEIMDEAMSLLARHREFANAPALAEAVHSSVRRISGVADPYQEVKQQDIVLARALKPRLVKYFEAQDRSLLAALKIAAIGNVLDSALRLDVDLDTCLEDELAADFHQCDLDDLTRELSTATTVLIIADNAGEGVFDQILLEALAAPGRELIYATRSAPIINDLTPAEASQIGIPQYARLIGSGSTVPGTILARCTAEFQELFASADVVISKGQGNFETISGAPRPIYFLLKAKCQLVANALATEIGRNVLARRVGALAA